jgi:hypothetical protein
MFRTLLTIVLFVYAGILIGEIPIGKTTVGRSAWIQTRNTLQWTGQQAHGLVTYAGFGELAVFKWLESQPTPKKSPRSEPKDEEGMTPSDKAALRKILE